MNQSTIPPGASPTPGFPFQRDSSLPDVQTYVRAVWARRWWTLGICVALIVGGAYWSVSAPPRYEGAVTVTVRPSKLGQPGAAGAGLANYIPLFSSHAVVAAVVSEFKLDRPPYGYTPAQFIRSRLTVRHLPETQLVRVVVILDEPKLAADVTNRLVERGVEFIRQVNQREMTTVLSDLRALVDAGRARMEETEARYDRYRNEAQLELLRKDVETQLTQRGAYRTLLVDIESARGRLIQAEAELAKRERVLRVRRRIDQEPLLGHAAEDRRQPGDQLAGLAVDTEYPSSVYENIDRAIAEGRTELAALEKRRAELVAEAGVGGARLERLALLYERESVLARLELERAVARKSFEDVSTRYQTAQLEAVERTSQVVVVDTAVPADRPMSRLMVRNVILGLLAGLALGTLLAIVDVLRRPASID